MLPGSTELQRMPFAAHCTAMFWLSCSTPALDAEYAALGIW